MTGGSPFICELIGPAGAGKTTITQAILNQEPGVRVVTPPTAGYYKNILFYAGNSMQLLPSFFHHLQKEKIRRVRKILQFLSLLQGWGDRLNHFENMQPGVLLLEQGPVYMLSCLQNFLLPAVFTEEFQEWRDRIYHRWARMLDLIVWLDTSDSVLIERVRSRLKNHGNKTRSHLDAVAVNESYRNTYTEILTNLTRINPSIRVCRVNTGINSVQEIVAQLLQDLK